MSFGISRSKFADRFYDLVGRFTEYHDRYRQLEDEAKFAVRQLMATSDEVAGFAQLANISELQAGHCGKAARQLLLHRALPIFFWRAVKQAEKLANQMEADLFQCNAGAAAGHAAFAKIMKS